MKRIKHLGMIQKLEIKLVSLIMISVLIVLLIISVIVCAVAYQNNMKIIDEQLKTANEQSSMAYFSFTEDVFKVPGVGNEPNSSNNWLEPRLDGDNNPSGRREFDKPKIGKHKEGQNLDLPIATYYVSKGTLVEAPNGLMTAYINSSTIESLTPFVVNANEGISTNEEHEIVFSKTTIRDVQFVAFTDISYYYSWTNTLKTMIFVVVITMILFLFVGIIFAKWASKPIKDAWDAQKRFVEDASHDLKTPLTVILANTSILKSKPEETIADQQTWIDSIQDESNKMTTLINDMLDLADIDDFATKKQDTKANLEVVDFSNIVQALCLQTETVAFDKKLKFNENVDNNIYVCATKEDLTKIASALISNSCKHAPSSDTITVTLKQSSGTAILSVNNKLSLIDTQDLPHVFDRFYRSDKSRSQNNKQHSEQSHGLGLAIAKSLAQQFSGDLSVESNKTSGTTFYAKFPAHKTKH